ncbi:MAG: hypothetical protein ACR2HB_07565 [Dehalococcoidia bacterium]
MLIAGITIGAALIGGIIGAGIDFATGNAGWWGAGVLAGLMGAALAVSRLVEGAGT